MTCGLDPALSAALSGANDCLLKGRMLARPFSPTHKRLERFHVGHRSSNVHIPVVKYGRHGEVCLGHVPTENWRMPRNMWEVIDRHYVPPVQN